MATFTRDLADAVDLVAGEAVCSIAAIWKTGSLRPASGDRARRGGLSRRFILRVLSGCSEKTVPVGRAEGGAVFQGDRKGLRMRIHEREPIGAALRRFKKLLERAGVKRELRAHEYYEKPCKARRQQVASRLRVIRKAASMPPRR